MAATTRERCYGLPDCVGVGEGIVIPAGKKAVKIELSAVADAATAATMLKVTDQATIGIRDVTQQLDPILLVVTMKPPFSIDAKVEDDLPQGVKRFRPDNHTRQSRSCH